MLCSTQNKTGSYRGLTSHQSLHIATTHTLLHWSSQDASPHPFSLNEGRKEMFHLTTHSTLYLRLYGVRHMVKDHSDSEKENTLLPHRLLFPISSKGSFICTIPQRIAHTTAFVTPVVEHWLEQEIAQWVHPMKDLSDDPSHHERTLLPRSYISLLHFHWIKSKLCLHMINSRWPTQLCAWNTAAVITHD